MCGVLSSTEVCGQQSLSVVLQYDIYHALWCCLQCGRCKSTDSSCETSLHLLLRVLCRQAHQVLSPGWAWCAAVG
jgi:hypothetical protein